MLLVDAFFLFFLAFSRGIMPEEIKLIKKQLLHKLRASNKTRGEERRREKVARRHVLPPPPRCTSPATLTHQYAVATTTPSPQASTSASKSAPERKIEASTNLSTKDESELLKFMNSVAACPTCKRRKEVNISNEFGVTKTYSIKCDQCNFRKEFCTSRKENQNMEVHRRMTEFGLKSEGYSSVEKLCVAMEMRPMTEKTFYKIVADTEDLGTETHMERRYIHEVKRKTRVSLL